MLRISRTAAIVLFLAFEVLSIGMGMGVPFFTILLGFGVGWFAARRRAEHPILDALRACLTVAWQTAAVSLVVLGALWLPWLPAAWGTEADLANTGVPLILYEPRASFIGWLVLMILVSPALQVLTTMAGSYLTLVRQRGAVSSQ